jgi:hypothetical protein
MPKEYGGSLGDKSRSLEVRGKAQTTRPSEVWGMHKAIVTLQ